MAIYLGNKQIAGSSINSINNNALCSISQSVVSYAYNGLGNILSDEIDLSSNILIEIKDESGASILRKTTLE